MENNVSSLLDKNMSPFNNYGYYSDKPVLCENVDIAAFDLTGLESSPQDVENWIKKQIDRVTKLGLIFTKIHVESRLNSIVLVGNRLETKEEYDERMNSIRKTWFLRFQEYLRLKEFYKSDLGRAQVREAFKVVGISNITEEMKKYLDE